MNWFRGGLVFKAHRLLYHPTLGSRVIKKKKKYLRDVDQQKVFIGAVRHPRQVERVAINAPPICCAGHQLVEGTS